MIILGSTHYSSNKLKKIVFFITLFISFSTYSYAKENYNKNEVDVCVGKLISFSIRGDVGGIAEFINHNKNNKRGCSIDSRDGNDLTALMYAATYGHNNVVVELLKNRANPNLKNKFETTALMLAAGNGYFEVVTTLLEYRADPNATNNYGTTALMLAAGNGYAEVVTALLKNGANPNLEDINGMNALFIAKKRNRSNIAKILKATEAKTQNSRRSL